VKDKVEATGLVPSTLLTPRIVLWEPKEDITAFELAMAIPVLIRDNYNVENTVKSLPADVARHFVVK